MMDVCILFCQVSYANRHKVLISNFRRVLNVIFFPLDDSPASEFYIPTFRNTMFHLHKPCKQEEFLLTPPMKMDRSSVPKRRHIKIQTPGNHPKERINR